MIFYGFKINSLPVPVHAFSVTTKEYKYKIRNRDKTIEFSYALNGEYRAESEKKVYKVKNGDIFVFIPGKEYTNYSETDEELSFLTVGAILDEFECTKYSCDNEEEWIKIKDKLKDQLIIPDIMTVGKEESSVSKMFRMMIKKFAEETVTGSYGFIGLFCELLAFINDETRKQLEGQFKTSMIGVYIRNSVEYIKMHYKEKISVSDIAKKCKVSTSYLCRIFKSETGKTFTEYLNEHRVNKAREILLKNPKMTAEMVVQEVGFCDVRYMNIMFKRFLGVTIRDCRKIDKELTLYSQKPWEKKIESEDKKTEEKN